MLISVDVEYYFHALLGLTVRLLMSRSTVCEASIPQRGASSYAFTSRVGFLIC